jgi:hypothetical protein
MHWLMLLSSRPWVCALSGSVRGRISELTLSKGARIFRREKFVRVPQKKLAGEFHGPGEKLRKVSSTSKRSGSIVRPRPNPPSSNPGQEMRNFLSIALKSRSGSACFTYLRLPGFRDSYYVRSGLLDRLNSDGFDYWCDRLFHFPHSFLRWRAFGLGTRNRPLRSLGYLACLTAFS